MSTLLPMVKKAISDQINQIKSHIMQKVRSKKRRNVLKKVSNREIKSLENNFMLKLLKI